MTDKIIKHSRFKQFYMHELSSFQTKQRAFLGQMSSWISR